MGILDALGVWHQQRATEPVPMPDQAGAFGGPLLPLVFPVVVDSNAIRNELIRMARTGKRTIMASAAAYGVLRLYCAPNVPEEVERHRDTWARAAGLDPDEVARAWHDTHLRLIRKVPVPSDPESFTHTERQRLRLLADPDVGDPDDVDTAALAVLLGVPLLSKDRKALSAVYGDSLNYDAHVQWLESLKAGGDLGPLGGMLYLTAVLGVAFGKAIFDLVKFVLRLPPAWLAGIGGALGVLSIFLLDRASEETKSRLGGGIKGVTVSTGRLLGEVAVIWTAAQEQFNELAAPAAPQYLAAELPAGPALVRSSLYHLARCPQPYVSVAEFCEYLLGRVDAPADETKVRVALRSNPCFTEVYRGRYQLGQALVRAAASEPVEELGHEVTRRAADHGLA